MDLNLPSLGNLEPEPYCGLFYVTRFPIYWRFETNDMVFASTLTWYLPPIMYAAAACITLNE